MSKTTMRSLLMCVGVLYLAVTVFSACRCKAELPFDVAAKFTASGWMGDGEAGTKFVQQLDATTQCPDSVPKCVKVTYAPGPKGFAGIYWQNKPDNWGDLPGDNLKQFCYKKLTFRARGEVGGEVIECKAGGINTPGKKYRDSFEVSSGKIVLERQWKQFTLNLENEDLSSVIGGFSWVAAKSANPNGLTFFLADIQYEQ